MSGCKRATASTAEAPSARFADLLCPGDIVDQRRELAPRKRLVVDDKYPHADGEPWRECVPGIVIRAVKPEPG